MIAILNFQYNKTAIKAAVKNSLIGRISITTMPMVRRDERTKLLRDVCKKK